MEGAEIEPILVRAIAPNKAKGQLEFKKDQQMTVERINHDTSMYFGFYGRKEGWFPDYFVQTVPNGKPEIRKKAPQPKPKPTAPTKPAPSTTTTTTTTAAPPKPTKKDKKTEAKEKKEESARAKRAQLEQKKKLARDKKGAKRGGGAQASGAAAGGTNSGDMAGDDVAIPSIIETTIAYLEDPDRLKLEGIFRVSGSLNDVKLIKESYEKGKKVDLSKVTDAHTVAGVLKIFFRESKDPLLTFELYDCWVAAIATPSEGDRVASVRQVIELLPAINRRILQRLTGLLVKVAELEQYNKMSVNNIAIVFAPTLLRPPGDRIDIALQDSSYANHLIKFIIEEYDILFFDKPAVPRRQTAPSTPAQYSEELPAIEQNVTEEEFDKRLRRGSLMIAKGSMTRGQNSSFVAAPYLPTYQEEDEDVSSDVSVDGAEESEGDDTNPSDNEVESDTTTSIHANMSMEEMLEKILEGNLKQVDEYLATLDKTYADNTKRELLERIDSMMQSDDFNA
eukprot:TRINITY_DN1792_c0_g1_i1.p1 TRINITY_DN1792_c0_g1~~TRINITY_DN1792_c0_g1_i1.p1  ORF type:complete len:507 (+),score=120.76 TRINITY_DN1792_c0_g1_i1:190-1710(+)